VQDFLDIVKKITEEVILRRIEPVTYCPKFIISLHCVPKDGFRVVNGQTIPKVRLVRNGSKRGMDGTSCINDFIAPIEKEVLIPDNPDYAKFIFGAVNDDIPLIIDDDDQIEDDIIDLDPAIEDGVYHFGWGSGSDLAHAYRQLPVHDDDAQYLGYCLCGLYFIDHYVPFGIASGSRICQNVTNYIVLGIRHNCLHHGFKMCLINYYDDFLVINKWRHICLHIFDILKKTLAWLGLEDNLKKEFGPTQKFATHGWIWDLRNQIAIYPIKKRKDIINLIQHVLKYKYCTIKYLFRLIGLIMDFSRINQLIKVVCHAMLTKIYLKLKIHRKTGKYLNMDQFIFIDFRIQQQLYFWKDQVHNNFQSFIYRIFARPSISMTLYTDAAKLGYGIFAEGHFCAAHFDLSLMQRHIHIKEFLAVIMAFHMLGHRFAGHHIHVYVDNTAVVCAMARKWAKDYEMMRCVYHMCQLITTLKCSVYFDWIPTDDNILADALSRDEWRKFWHHINEHNIPVYKQYVAGNIPPLLYS